MAAEVDVDAAAFEVEDSDAMEARLVYFGIEYTKAIVPGTDAAQLFFFDPGNVLLCVLLIYVQFMPMTALVSLQYRPVLANANAVKLISLAAASDGQDLSRTCL